MSDHVSDRLIWIWLSLACGAGSRVYSKLFASFSTLSEIYESPRERFSEIDGISAHIADALADKDMTRAKEIYSVCRYNGWTVLTYGDKAYPKRLKMLEDPPVVLYCRGRMIDLDDNVCIAVVGTRRMSEYGERQAYRLSYAMASGGAVIVSGMALGCDAMAANGALDAGAPTVAVLGCGIDIVYPYQHRTLADHIARGGMIMTEYPPGSPPEGSHFPVRNRIISGLSQGTLIVEAPDGSGALITARKAASQGREIFAVPGEVGRKNSEGCNRLIKGGAIPVTTAADVLGVYEFIYPHRINIGAVLRAEREVSESFGQRTAQNRRISSRPAEGEQKISVSTETEAREEPEEKKRILSRFSKKAERKEVKKDNPNGGKTAAEETFSFEHDSGVIPPEENTSLTARDREVLAAIGEDPFTPDELVSRGYSAAEIMSTLTILELFGYISAQPGGRYKRKI